MKPLYFALLFVAVLGFLAGRFFQGDSSPESFENSDRGGSETMHRQQTTGVNSQKNSLEPSVEDSLVELLAEKSAWERIAKVTTLAEGWDSSELKAAVRYLTAHRKEANAERLLSVVLTRWNAVDREAALEQTIELHNLREGAVMCLVLEQLTDWARNDFDGVWRYADRIEGNKELAGRFRFAALSTLAETDPGRALQLYSSLDEVDRMEGVVGAIAAELAKVDLPRAKALVESASKREQKAIVSGIMRFYSEADPEAGLAYLAQLPVHLAQPHPHMYTLVAPWMQRAPKEAIAAIQAQLSGDLREQALSTAMSLWSQQDLGGAISWLLPQLDDPAMVRAWQNLSYTLVRSDPIRGIELIQAHPELDEVKNTYFSAWVQDDVDSALDWALANLKASDLSDVLGRSVYSISHSGPAAAAQIVDLMPMGGPRDRALVNIARRLAGRDVDHAVEWVLQQPEDAAQRNALSQVMGVWTEQSPEAAAAFVQSGFQTDNDLLRQQLVREVAGTMAKKDPIAALDWVDGLGDEAMSEAAMGNLLFEWSRNDLGAATAYVAKLTSQETRSEHYSRLVLNAVQEDPAQAIEWVDSLPDEDRSDAIYTNLYTFWLDRDSVAASEWIDQLPKGRERDLAATQVVSAVDDKSPKEALPWALQIENEQMRDRALGMVIRGASRLDLDVLRESIDAVSDEGRQEHYRRQYLGE